MTEKTPPESKDPFIKSRVAALGGKVDDADSLFQRNWIQQYKPFAVDLMLSEERINYIGRSEHRSAFTEKNLMWRDMASKNASEWLAEFPGPITIDRSFLKLFLFFLGLIGAAAMCAVDILINAIHSQSIDWKLQLVAWPTLILFLSLAVFCWSFLARGRMKVILGLDDFVIHARRVIRYSWSDVRDLKLVQQTGPLPSYGFSWPCVRFNIPMPSANKANGSDRTVQIPSLYNIRTDELFDLMQGWQEKALQARQSQLENIAP